MNSQVARLETDPGLEFVKVLLRFGYGSHMRHTLLSMQYTPDTLAHDASLQISSDALQIRMPSLSVRISVITVSQA